MPKKSLDASEIKKILRVSEKVKKDNGITPKWPTRNEKLAIMQAMKNKDKTVELSSGTFKVKHRPKDNTYFVSPKDKRFVPCGYFSVEELGRDLAVG